MSAWAGLVQRKQSRSQSPHLTLTVSSLREELDCFAKGPMTEVLSDHIKDRLEDQVAATVRDELRMFEHRLLAAVQSNGGGGGGGGGDDDKGGSQQRGRDRPGHGFSQLGVHHNFVGARASMFLHNSNNHSAPGHVQSTPTGFGHTQSMAMFRGRIGGMVGRTGSSMPDSATAWITKRRVSNIKKVARRNSFLQPRSDSRSKDEPSYHSVALLEMDEEEAGSASMYGSEVENSEGHAAEDDASVRSKEDQLAAARGRMQQLHARQHHPKPQVARDLHALHASEDPSVPSQLLEPTCFNLTWLREDFSSWAHEMVQSIYFEYVSCAAVLINSVLLGWETDWLARHITEDMPIEFKTADLILCTFFVLELTARICVHGKAFFCGECPFLNLFDLALVITQVMDEVVNLVHVHTNAGVLLLRNLRIVRFLRVLRLTRVLSLVGELRTLLVSIASSLKSLVWVVILMAVITYSFGIFLTHIVITTRMHHLSEGEAEWEGEAELSRWYGSVVISMLSLFEAVSEGIHWAQAMEPLTEYCSPWLTALFLCYIIFAIFALLNVVTGLFVEAAIATASEDKKTVLCQQMCQLFMDCDIDNSGTVSWQEWEEHLRRPEMESYLKELDIDIREAPLLFALLDGDGTGNIDAEELVGGCLRLHGGAKALELAALIHEFRNFSKQWRFHAQRVEEALHVEKNQDDAPRLGRSISLIAGNSGVGGFARPGKSQVGLNPTATDPNGSLRSPALAPKSSSTTAAAARPKSQPRSDPSSTGPPPPSAPLGYVPPSPPADSDGGVSKTSSWIDEVVMAPGGIHHLDEL
mmetsp:Transcript_73883/g.161679  ORF Transcript_73883/g.161679 Transcript_73883/m.161679 type:complete len:811 (-) Transcript_73883:245-2677(-)